MIKLDIIGLAAPAGTGKSTVARSLRRHRGYEVLSFAGPIRDMIAAIGVPRAAFSNTEDKKRPLTFLFGEETTISPRYLMQTLGTEWGRQLIDRSIWVKLADYSIKFLKQQREDLVRQAAAGLADLREKADRFAAGEVEGPATPEGRIMTVEEVMGEVERVSNHIENSKTLRIVFDDVRFPEELNLIQDLGGRVYRLHRDSIVSSGEHQSEFGLNDYVMREITLPLALTIDPRGLYDEGEALTEVLNSLVPVPLLGEEV